MKLEDILLPKDEPSPHVSLSGSPVSDNVKCNERDVYRHLFADFQRQASVKESQLYQALEQLGRDNQVQRVRFNEASVRVQNLEEALRASEIRAATLDDQRVCFNEASVRAQKLEEELRASEIRAASLHDQLEDERLEHHATRESLRFEQWQQQVTNMEIPHGTAEDRLLNQLSRLNEDVDHIKNQQGWFIKEGMLARQMHVRSSSDIMLCVHMAETLGVLRIRIDLTRPLPQIIHFRWTQFEETWNKCMLLTLEGQSTPSQMHYLWPKLMDEKVSLEDLLMRHLNTNEP